MSGRWALPSFAGGQPKSGLSITLQRSQHETVFEFQWLETEDVESVIQRFASVLQRALAAHSGSNSKRSCSVRVLRLSPSKESSDHEVFAQTMAMLVQHGLRSVACSEAGAFLQSGQGLSAAMLTVPELDISRCNLSDVPARCFLLTKLQSLDLSYNKLSALPKTISQLSALTRLAADGNLIATLPGAHRARRLTLYAFSCARFELVASRSQHAPAIVHCDTCFARFCRPLGTAASHRIVNRR